MHFPPPLQAMIALNSFASQPTLFSPLVPSPPVTGPSIMTAGLMLQVPSGLTQLLHLSGSFIPTPPLSKFDISKGIRRFLRLITLRKFFDDQNDQKLNWLPVYCATPSTFEPPPLPSNLILALENIAVTNAITSIRKSNISAAARYHLEHTDFNRLPLVIKQTDKNLGLCIMHKGEYQTLMMTMLDDPSTYRSISPPNYPVTISRVKAELIRLLRRFNFKIKWTKSKGFTEYIDCTYSSDFMPSITGAHNSPWSAIFIEILNRLTPKPDHEVPLPPWLYGMPKIHKPTPQLRPILAFHSSYLYPLSKYLADELNYLTSFQPLILTSTPDLVARLIAFPPLDSNSNYFFTTLDVTALYPNLDIPLNNKAIWKHLRQWYFSFNWAAKSPLYSHLKLETLTPRVFLRRLEFILDLVAFTFSNSHLRFASLLFEQVFGCGMGHPVAPPYAQLALNALEVPIISQACRSGILLFYARYLDDIFMITRGNSADARTIVNTLNSQQPRLQFTGPTTQASTTPVPFMDLAIYLLPSGVIAFHNFAKLMSKFLYLPFKSFHSRACLRGLVIGELKRMAINSSSSFQFQQSATSFFYHLLQRQYPPHWLLKIFSAADYNSRLTTLTTFAQRAHCSLFDPHAWPLLRHHKSTPPQTEQLSIYLPSGTITPALKTNLKRWLHQVDSTTPETKPLASLPLRCVPTTHQTLGSFLIRANR